jgi:exosortase
MELALTSSRFLAMCSPEVVATLPPAVSPAAGSADLSEDSFPGATARVSWQGVRLDGWVLAALVAILYWPILQKLVADWWDDPNYSHGFLVPIFSGYLIWQRRGQLAALAPRGSWTMGVPVLLLGLGLLVLGEVGAERFLAASSLVVVGAGLILLHLGPAIGRRLAFPLAYLLFAIPIPSIVFYAIAFPLQQLAAANAAWTLDLLGVPVLLDGNVIHLSQITLGVTEACSGIRSLVSMLALAVAWGALTFGSPWATALLVASAVPITVVANAGRVVATGLVGQYAGVEYATGVFHTLSGWVIFLIAFAGLLGVHTLLRWLPALRPVR